MLSARHRKLTPHPKTSSTSTDRRCVVDGSRSPRNRARTAPRRIRGERFIGGDIDMPESHVVAAELTHRFGTTVVSIEYQLAKAGVHSPISRPDCRDDHALRPGFRTRVLRFALRRVWVRVAAWLSCAGINRRRRTAKYTAVRTTTRVSLDDLPVAGAGPEAIAHFAGRYFDFSTSRPSLARLPFWEGPEWGYPVGAETRTLRSANKVAKNPGRAPPCERDGSGRPAADNRHTVPRLGLDTQRPPCDHRNAGRRRRRSIMRTSELHAQDAVNMATRPSSEPAVCLKCGNHEKHRPSRI